MIWLKYNILGHKDLENIWANKESLFHFLNMNETALDAIANNMLILWWQMHFWNRASTLIAENPLLHKLKKKINQVTCWKPFWPKDGSRVNFNFVSTPRKKKKSSLFHLAQKTKRSQKNPNTKIPQLKQEHKILSSYFNNYISACFGEFCLLSGFQEHVKKYTDKMFFKCSNALFNDVVWHNSFH